MAIHASMAIVFFTSKILETLVTQKISSILQLTMCIGIFWPFEQFSEVRKLVFNHLIDPTRLYSLTFLQKTMSDDTATLAQLGMVFLFSIILFSV